MFFAVYETLYEEKDPSLKSLVVGNCITIMHQPIQPMLYSSFWPNMNLTATMSNNNSNINYSQNSLSEDYLTQYLGTQLRIFQLNVEGFISDKSRYLERLLKEHKIDAVLMQETHIPDELQMIRRETISGFTLISALYHRNYRSATYVRNH
ncbi:hypothetical protein QTP88_015389 [Uroleucon formosanum]